MKRNNQLMSKIKEKKKVIIILKIVKRLPKYLFFVGGGWYCMFVIGLVLFYNHAFLAQTSYLQSGFVIHIS